MYYCYTKLAMKIDFQLICRGINLLKVTRLTDLELIFYIRFVSFVSVDYGLCSLMSILLLHCGSKQNKNVVQDSRHV